MFLKSLAVSLMFAAIAISPAVAVTLNGTSDEFIGLFDGNDPFPNTSITFNNSLALAKCDNGSENTDGCAASTVSNFNEWDYNKEDDVDETGAGSGEAGDAFGRFALSYLTETLIDWSFDDSTSLGVSYLLPSFVAVKHSQEYAVWSIAGLTSGQIEVSGGGVGFGDISHVSFYDTDPRDDVPDPIPVPAALPLFASALAGAGVLRWWRRRRVAEN
jgi:hypothetical protein